MGLRVRPGIQEIVWRFEGSESTRFAVKTPSTWSNQCNFPKSSGERTSHVRQMFGARDDFALQEIHAQIDDWVRSVKAARWRWTETRDWRRRRSLSSEKISVLESSAGYRACEICGLLLLFIALTWAKLFYPVDLELQLNFHSVHSFHGECENTLLHPPKHQTLVRAVRTYLMKMILVERVAQLRCFCGRTHSRAFLGVNSW